MIKPEIKSESQYREERAICDRAAAYWSANASYSKSGASSLSAELAAHPDYAACSNEMRGRVDQWETLNNPPERFVAYIGSDETSRPIVTVWTGFPLGYARCTGKSARRGANPPLFSYRATIAGREYYGRGQGEGMAILLRETAASKRARKESGK